MALTPKSPVDCPRPAAHLGACGQEFSVSAYHLGKEACCLQSCSLPTLLYRCETWTCYRRHLKKLDHFHLRCLRRLLCISWEDRVTNQEVPRRSNMPGVEILVMKAQLRWTGHVMRMEDSRLPKQIFCSELAGSSRRQGRQTKRYKVSLKNSLRACDIPVKSWEHLAADRSAWRLATHNGAQAFEERRLSPLDIKRQARKETRANPAAAVACPVCGCICGHT